MGESLFDLAGTGVELCFDGHEVVMGADGKGPIRKRSVACAGSAVDLVGVAVASRPC